MNILETERHVGLLITPGKHGITEHRIAILDFSPHVNDVPAEDVAPKFPRLGYMATEELARAKARKLADEHNLELVTYRTTLYTYYNLVPKT